MSSFVDDLLDHPNICQGVRDAAHTEDARGNLRPLPATQADATCRWGGCGRTAVVLKRDPEFGWLPVCLRCVCREPQEGAGRTRKPKRWPATRGSR